MRVIHTFSDEFSVDALKALGGDLDKLNILRLTQVELRGVDKIVLADESGLAYISAYLAQQIFNMSTLPAKLAVKKISLPVAWSLRHFFGTYPFEQPIKLSVIIPSFLSQRPMG